MSFVDTIATLFWHQPAAVAQALPVDFPFTAAHLAAAGVKSQLASEYLAPLNAAAREFDIVTPQRASMFLATVAWESEEFKYTREIWGPIPAQLKYEGRADLGNVKPGDGFRYRGGGLIEITGRYNYGQASQALYGDQRLVSSPDLIIEPVASCRASAWFWHMRGCNEAADVPDFVKVTRLINGGTNGLQERTTILGDVQRSMGIL